MNRILLTNNPSMLLLFLSVLFFSLVNGQPNVFDLIRHGGSSAKSFDNSKALASAWSGACAWAGKGEAQVVIPSGTYFLNPVELRGPCKTRIRFTTKGYIVGPTGSTKLEYWIRFCNVDGLIIEGGVFIDQGASIWNNPGSISSGYKLMGLDFVKNANIQNVKLMNSKKTHLHLFGCSNIDMYHVTINSPESSPNTDGIKMSESTGIKIHDTNIASGDDCVAILTGTTYLNVTRVLCGPGHGISIGSLGDQDGEKVSHVTVSNCTFVGTSNGARIKSKITRFSGLVSDVTFRDLIIDQVKNPIIIDQNYCPPKNCPKGSSNVQIKGVNFANINGTSATKVAVSLICSGSNPCQDIRLSNIDLSYVRRGVTATSYCSNAHGLASGFERPKSCL